MNAAKHAAERNYQRDGSMRFDENGGTGPNYWPNSFDGPAPDPSAADPGMPVSGVTGRTPYPHANDDYEQAGVLYRDVMTDEDRDHLVSNIVGHLGNAQERIRLRQCAVFYKADPEYGTRVAEGVEVDLEQVKRLAAMTPDERAAATAAGAGETAAAPGRLTHGPAGPAQALRPRRPGSRSSVLYLISTRLAAITSMPPTRPYRLSCPLPYARLVGRSSSRLMYTMIPATPANSTPISHCGTSAPLPPSATMSTT